MSHTLQVGIIDDKRQPLIIFNSENSISVCENESVRVNHHAVDRQNVVYNHIFFGVHKHFMELGCSYSAMIVEVNCLNSSCVYQYVQFWLRLHLLHQRGCDAGDLLRSTLKSSHCSREWGLRGVLKTSHCMTRHRLSYILSPQLYCLFFVKLISFQIHWNVRISCSDLKIWHTGSWDCSLLILHVYRPRWRDGLGPRDNKGRHLYILNF